MMGALILGLFFGILLQKAGLTRYEVIVGAFRLTDMTVLKFMMSAILVALVTTFALHDLGLLTLEPRETYVLGNLLGGAALGIGMVLTGFCPGSCVAGSGQGGIDYLIPGLLGLLAGGVLFGATYESVYLPLHAVANYGRITLAGWLGVSPWFLILALGLLFLWLFRLFERLRL